MNWKKEEGASMVEVSLVMFFFLLFIGAGVEMVSFLRTSLLTQSIAREVATVTFRDCTLRLYGANPDLTALQQCLDQRMPALKDQYAAVLNGVTIQASVYIFDPSSRRSRTPVVSPQQLPAFASQISQSAFDSGERNSLLTDQKLLVYGEASFKWVPHLPSLWKFLGGGVKVIHATAAV